VKKNFLTFPIILVLSLLTASGQFFSVASIPDSLLENADIVIRDFDQQFVMNSVNSGKETVKKVWTILNKEGENKASLYIIYDKDKDVKVKQIVFYDKSGKKIRTVKQSEIQDTPAHIESVLFSDDRIISFSPIFAEYPYTVEYDYEIDFENHISFKRWMPVFDYNISVAKARLSVIHSSDNKIYRKEINVPHGSKESENGMEVDSWEIRNIKAIEDEPFDESVTERVPSVYLMPAILKYDKNVGTSDSWMNYGAWIKSLYVDKDILPVEAKMKISSLINDIPDTLLRIKVLYDYLQQNTRYVAVALGIGGYQPFDAETVYRTGYGDCKALSNYMSSMLKLTGVKSYPALVSSGRHIESIFNDFPNFGQFDHVILCVPFRHDTIWLECTSQQIPFGFLGDFSDDRQVLLITENGGIFAHTPRYDTAENSMKCTSYLSIDSSGMAKCSIKTVVKGLQYDDFSSFLSLNVDEQKKWYYKNSDLPSLQITGFSVRDDKTMHPSATIDVELSSKNYASFSGKYILLPLNLINNQKPVQKMLKSRQSEIEITRSFADYDSLVYRLPVSYKPESLPKGTEIKSDFGIYSYNVRIDGNKLIYVRNFTLYQGRFKPSQYNKLYDFIMSISKADNLKVLLTK
jgi:hypothetical protein